MYLSASFAANAHAAITKRMLKTAEPTMVPGKKYIYLFLSRPELAYKYWVGQTFCVVAKKLPR